MTGRLLRGPEAEEAFNAVVAMARADCEEGDIRGAVKQLRFAALWIGGFDPEAAKWAFWQAQRILKGERENG